MSTSTSATLSGGNSRAFAAIGAAVLLAGAMDITAAFLTWASRGITPVRILQGIASAAIGPKSFDGGMATAALGLAFHFLIAFSAATVFYFASRKISFLLRQPILAGVLYGVAVYLVMYWIVVPLSLAHRGRFSIFNTVVAILTHMVCVGLPISLMVRRFSR
ncbi:MAG: hypothetical protein ACRD4K_05620 [Candidatus Acidiferrales bacterium]